MQTPYILMQFNNGHVETDHDTQISDSPSTFLSQFDSNILAKFDWNWPKCLGVVI